MKTTKLYAAADLHLEDDVTVARGTVIGTIETDVPLDKLIAGLQTGRVTTTEPKPIAPVGESPAATATARTGALFTAPPHAATPPHPAPPAATAPPAPTALVK